MWNSVCKRQEVYYFATAAFVIISFLFIFLWKNQPYISLEIANQNGQWVVVASDQSGEGYSLGIRTGDIILGIDHDAVENFEYVQKWNQAEGASTIEFRKPGQNTSFIVNIAKKDAATNILSKLPLFFLGFIFCVFGFITWRKRPFLVQARALFWLNLCIGLAINISPASSCGIPFAKEAENIFFALIPLLLINFFSVIPIENKSIINKYAKIFFLLSYIVIFSLTLFHSLWHIHISFFLRKYILVIVTMGIIYVLLNLIMTARHKDVKIRNQSIILLGGTVLGFFPSIVLITIPSVFSVSYAQNLEAGSIFVAFIPMIWYYVIINQYLPDSRKLFVKVVSFVSAASISSILLVLILIYLNILMSLTLSLFLMIFSVTVIVMFCFLLLSEVSFRLLEKFNIYESDRTINKKVLQLTDSLVQIDENDLFEQMMRTLEINGIYFIAENQKTGDLKRIAGIYSDDTAAQEKMAKYFEANKRVLIKAEEGREAVVLSPDVPAAIYIPFVYENFTCGIFLGHHHSYIKYEQFELTFITLIAKQMAQHFLNSFTIKNLSQEIQELDRKSKLAGKRNKRFQWMPGFFFNNMEKERKSIAEEIHAGPLQLGLDISRWLKVLNEEPHRNWDEKTVQVMTYLRKIIEQLNYELRQTCNNLRPPTLSQLGLISAVELLCEDKMFKESLVISLKSEGIDRDDRFSENVEIAAYRFVQEGIANALKHADVDCVQISLTRSQHLLVLTIVDEGKGFDPKQLDGWFANGIHLGLVGIKERIESLGGNLQVQSKIGIGTTLKAAIPIA